MFTSSAKTCVPGCSKYLLTEGDITVDKVAARLLMYHPWQHEKHAYIWKTAITVPQDDQ